MGQMSLADLPIDYRRYYAVQSHTTAERIRYWVELDADQQQYARRLFNNTNMSDHVYTVGSGGSVLSRRMIEYGDNPQPNKANQADLK